MASLTKALQKVSLEDGDQETLVKRREGKRLNGDTEGQEEEAKEEENRTAVDAGRGLFRFFDLPTEIRLRIYMFVLFTPRRSQRSGSVGASAKNMPLSPLSHRLSLFLASRRLHDEASHYMYSTLTFRLFSVQDYSRLPTVRGLSARYRGSLSTVELILGSSWTKPPPSWTVTKSLGLKDMTHLHTLKVFIEVDPSHPVFRGFRLSKGYYTHFAGELLQQVLNGLPGLAEVEFDGNPSVQKNGDLMRRLLREARLANKKIRWGPQRGWTNYDFEEIIQDEQIQDLVV